MSKAPAPAWSMTVGPSHLLLEPGHSGRLSVTDTGTKPMAVSTSVVNVTAQGKRCVAAPGTVKGITVSPAHLALAPGQTGYATVTVAKGAPDADAAAVFTASAGPGTGTAQVSGAVGSQVVVGHVPGCHIPVPHPVAAPAHGGGIPVAGLAGLALVAALCAVAAGAWLKRHLRWQ